MSQAAQNGDADAPTSIEKRILKKIPDGEELVPADVSFYRV